MIVGLPSTVSRLDDLDVVHAEDLVDDGLLLALLLLETGRALLLVLRGQAALPLVGLLLLLAVLLGQLGLGQRLAVARHQAAVGLAGKIGGIDLVDLGLGLLDAAARVQARLLEDLREGVLVQDELVALEVLPDLLEKARGVGHDRAGLSGRGQGAAAQGQRHRRDRQKSPHHQGERGAPVPEFPHRTPRRTCK